MAIAAQPIAPQSLAPAGGRSLSAQLAQLQQLINAADVTAAEALRK